VGFGVGVVSLRLFAYLFLFLFLAGLGRYDTCTGPRPRPFWHGSLVWSSETVMMIMMENVAYAMRLAWVSDTLKTDDYRLARSGCVGFLLDSF
jgi:hypothetical protein